LIQKSIRPDSILILQLVRGDFCDSIDPKRTTANKSATSASDKNHTLDTRRRDAIDPTLTLLQFDCCAESGRSLWCWR
jgi:hypothetical protein